MHKNIPSVALFAYSLSRRNNNVVEIKGSVLEVLESKNFIGSLGGESGSSPVLPRRRSGAAFLHGFGIAGLGVNNVVARESGAYDETLFTI